MISENASNDEIFAALRLLVEAKPAATAKPTDLVPVDVTDEDREEMVEALAEFNEGESEFHITAEIVEYPNAGRTDALEPLDVADDRTTEQLEADGDMPENPPTAADDPVLAVAEAMEEDDSPRVQSLTLPKEIIAFAKAFPANDESRPVLAGIHIKHVGEWTVYTSADGFVLGEMAQPIAPGHANDWDIIVPARQIIDIGKMVGKQHLHTMTIELVNDQWMIGSPARMMWSQLQLIEGKFISAQTIFDNHYIDSVDKYGFNPVYMERLGQFCKAIDATAFRAFFHGETSGAYCMPMGESKHSTSGYKSDELPIRIMWMPMLVGSSNEQEGPETWPVPRGK